MEFSVVQVGTVRADEEGFRIELLPEYAPALQRLEGFSHVQMIWWCDRCDNATSRALLTGDKPYTQGPEVMGIFATRSPERPNPIALTAVYVTYIDHEHGVIGLAYTDAIDGSPVLDIKPYTPSLDRVEAPSVPAWCAHWPKSVEVSGDFDWGSEFNFA